VKALKACPGIDSLAASVKDVTSLPARPAKVRPGGKFCPFHADRLTSSNSLGLSKTN
jgi:hypothetical protein